MKNTMMHWAVVAAVVGASSVSAFGAQDAAPQKTLPTLLIKGEVVSVDTTDAAATLLKVKDRYGFETPIYLTQDTKVGQGSQTLAVSNLTPGTAVEVEYNFDINTAKRHAVRVEVGAASQSAGATTPAAAPAAPSAAAPASSAAPAAATMPSATAPSATATPPAAPAAKAATSSASAPAAASASTTPPAPASAAPSTGGATAKERSKEHAGTTTQ